MTDPIEITSKSGLRFKMAESSAHALNDFAYNPETNQMESVPFPSDIADLNPGKAVELAKRLGYQQDADGVWVDPLIGFFDAMLAARQPGEG